MFAIVFVTVLVAAGVSGQTYLGGTCSDYGKAGTQANFDVAKYLGKWNEVARYENFFERDGDCVTATYSLNDDGTVKVVNAMKNLQSGDSEVIEGFAVEQNPEKHDGKLLVQFPTTPVAAQYWVMATDYENYSVVWSCYDIFFSRNVQFLWILSKSPEPSQEIKDKINAAIEANGFNTSELRKTEQSAKLCT